VRPAQRRKVLRFLRLGLVGAALVMVALFMRDRETITIPLDDYSLSPIYPPGTKFVLKRIEPDDPLPRGADVVYVVHPEGKTRAQFGRVRGLPGDIIGAENGHLTVNGKLIDRPAPIAGSALGEVPPGKVCVLAVSTRLPPDVAPDSRVFGFLPREDIKAIIRYRID
jgi:signal peptidase I